MGDYYSQANIYIGYHIIPHLLNKQYHLTSIYIRIGMLKLYYTGAPQTALRPSQARKDNKPSDQPHRSQGTRLSTL